MVPEHLREEMLIRFRAGGGHGGGDHLAASPGDGDMRFVREMAAEVGSVDQRRLGIGATLQLLIGPEQRASCRRGTACWWIFIGRCRFVLIEAMQILRHRQGRSGHFRARGQGVHRSICPHERAVNVDRTLLHEACLPAELDRLPEELFEHVVAEARACFREDAVVGRRQIDVVAQEPAVAQVQAHLFGQTPFGCDAVEVAQQEHLEDDDRIDGWLPGVAVVGTAEWPDEGEVDGFGDAPQQMVLGYELVQ